MRAACSAVTRPDVRAAASTPPHAPEARAEMEAAPTPFARSDTTYPTKMPTGLAKVKGRTTLQNRSMLQQHKKQQTHVGAAGSRQQAAAGTTGRRVEAQHLVCNSIEGGRPTAKRDTLAAGKAGWQRRQPSMRLRQSAAQRVRYTASLQEMTEQKQQRHVGPPPPDARVHNAAAQRVRCQPFVAHDCDKDVE